ncbi:MAG: hypothetical protein Q9218_007642, partial [Villophora microphyllina]
MAVTSEFSLAATLPTILLYFFTLICFLPKLSYARTIDPILPATPTNSTNVGTVPNPWIWFADSKHHIEFDRPTPDHTNPGVNPLQWRSAVIEATWLASHMQQTGGVDIHAAIPGGRFVYENVLIPPSAHRGQPARRIRIEARGTEYPGTGVFVLRYEDVHSILRGLLEYEKMWTTGA